MKVDLSKVDAVLKTIDDNAKAIFFVDTNSIPRYALDHIDEIKGVKSKPFFIGLDVPVGKTVDDCVALYQIKEVLEAE